MSTQDLKAGRQWIERRFEEIAREYGATRALAQEDRWRANTTLRKPNHSMSYYMELRGHLTRGEVTFWDVDLEIAGTGEPAAREKLGRHIRDVLASPSDGRSRLAFPAPPVPAVWRRRPRRYGDRVRRVSRRAPL